ncbi:hypothetical protein K432DRAFT_397976 [Lepidopterella palustris CBS 459.81]|uniref:Uncharacterized protein n=1 Tax=Lepidopterella palustris CBS 459.81 TaxID=1314670 RepID=A0A8E2J9N2_9PEZI|nr:hypothetical protein K432DRAFT_397976 [Lepidopterella palustris CBS 459.81]
MTATALTALQYLPIPLSVLSSPETIVLLNEPRLPKIGMSVIGDGCPPRSNNTVIGYRHIAEWFSDLDDLGALISPEWLFMMLLSMSLCLHEAQNVPGSRGLTRSKGSDSDSSFSGGRSGTGFNPLSSVVTPALQSPQFPPLRPQSHFGVPPAAPVFQKATESKDAIPNFINMSTYAMWEDERFRIPNTSLLKLMPNA